MKKAIESVLKLEHVVIDTIDFKREGFKTNSGIENEIQIQIASLDDGQHKVSLLYSAKKDDEYSLNVKLSGFFVIDNYKDDVQSLLQVNAVAILLPYLRSEITLISSQPEMDPIIIPLFNVAEMMNDNK